MLESSKRHEHFWKLWRRSSLSRPEWGGSGELGSPAVSQDCSERSEKGNYVSSERKTAARWAKRTESAAYRHVVLRNRGRKEKELVPSTDWRVEKNNMSVRHTRFVQLAGPRRSRARPPALSSDEAWEAWIGWNGLAKPSLKAKPSRASRGAICTSWESSIFGELKVDFLPAGLS